MSKRLNIAVFVLFVSAKSLTGAGLAPHLQFGVFFNPVFTWLQSDVNDVVPGKVRTGFDFGMSMDYFFAENYAFSSGLSMFNTGGTLKYNNGTFHNRDNTTISILPNSDVKYQIQYVKIPVALKFKTHLIGRMVYSANIGFDLMARASSSAYFRDTDNELFDGINANKEISFFNMGWFFGGVISYHLGGDAFIYSGLVFMDTFTDMTVPSRDMIKSQNLFLRLGIVF